jgi:hypothetical protein
MQSPVRLGSAVSIMMTVLPQTAITFRTNMGLGTFRIVTGITFIFTATYTGLIFNQIKIILYVLQIPRSLCLQPVVLWWVNGAIDADLCL